MALPNASESTHHSSPSWRLPKRSFAIFVDNHHDDGRVALWAASGDGAQTFLVESNPDRYFVPPYMGPSGWVGMLLNAETDWDEVAGIIEDAYDAANY